MTIAVLANAAQKEELQFKNFPGEITVLYVESLAEIDLCTSADAFFILSEEITFTNQASINKPVFLNSVTNTLAALHAPVNISRINGWPGFLSRQIWEVATNESILVAAIFDKLGWNYILVPDQPGLVAARVIASIINEAYYALQENVASRENIDLAMKLGTNYPYGPFEWAEKIGLEKIYSLLSSLQNGSNNLIAESLATSFNDQNLVNKP